MSATLQAAQDAQGDAETPDGSDEPPHEASKQHNHPLFGGDLSAQDSDISMTGDLLRGHRTLHPSSAQGSGSVTQGAGSHQRHTGPTHRCEHQLDHLKTTGFFQFEF